MPFFDDILIEPISVCNRYWANLTATTTAAAAVTATTATRKSKSTCQKFMDGWIYIYMYHKNGGVWRCWITNASCIKDFHVFVLLFFFTPLIITSPSLLFLRLSNTCYSRVAWIWKQTCMIWLENIMIIVQMKQSICNKCGSPFRVGASWFHIRSK